MSPSRTVLIEVVHVGEPVTGGWCPMCMLPSVISQRVALVTGMSVLREYTARGCTGCGLVDW